MKLSNEKYDLLKEIALRWLPALGTLVSMLAAIWGWKYGALIVGSITAVDTALGELLGISSRNYNGGDEDDSDRA